MKFKENCLPVVILLIICIVCVGLLAVLNDLWYVTDAEKFNRALRKIYPVADATFSDVDLVSGSTSNDTYGEVKAVYGASDGGYVVEALGKGGFNNGTATLYVAISSEAKIVGWSIKDNVGQTYVSNITKNHLATWYIGSDISKVIELTADVTCAGTSKTSTAINSAINMACEYARTELGLGENPEAAALSMIKAGLADTDYAAAELTAVAPKLVAHLTVGGAKADFAYSAVVDGETVYALVYGSDYVVFVQSIFDDERVVVANSDGFTSEMQDAVTANYFDGTGVILSAENGVYSVKSSIAGYVPGAYTLKVTIVDYKVTAIEVTTSGYEPGPSEDITLELTRTLVGCTSATVDTPSHVAGATESADIIRAAVKLALLHADANA